jgi:hypothetical protein
MTRKQSYSSDAACLPRRSGTKAGVLECVRQAKRDAAFPGFPLSILGRLQKPLEVFRSLLKGKINNPFLFPPLPRRSPGTRPWRRRVHFVNLCHPRRVHSGSLRKAIVAYCRLRKTPRGVFPLFLLCQPMPATPSCCGKAVFNYLQPATFNLQLIRFRSPAACPAKSRFAGRRRVAYGRLRSPTVAYGRLPGGAPP